MQRSSPIFVWLLNSHRRTADEESNDNSLPRGGNACAHQCMSNSDSYLPVDGENPFKCLTRGVESDVLCILGRRHNTCSGSEISTISGRSRSQIQNVLRYLGFTGVVKSEKRDGVWLNQLNPEHPLEPLIREIAVMRIPEVGNEVSLPGAVHALDAIDE